MRRALVTIGVCLALGFAPQAARAQAPGQGVQSGRASLGDLQNLRQAIADFIYAERLFNTQTGEIVPNLEVERQRQLLGTTDDPDPDRPSTGMGAAELFRRQWWIDHVLQPALDIAANPAASCALAQSILRRILNIERQGQLVVGDAQFGDFGDSDAIMGRAFAIAKRRCLEEAFDECMNTGNGQALIVALTEWSRQVGLVTGEDRGAWEEQVEYLFIRCTVYRLSYHMDLRSTGVIPESYTADGSFTLLFQLGETGEPIARMAQGLWRAPWPQDRPDITLSDPHCGRSSSRCEEQPPVWQGAAWGLVLLQRDVTEQTIEIFRTKEEARQPAPSGGGHTTVTDQILGDPDRGQQRGGVVVLRTTRHQEGRNGLTLNFGPPIVGYQVSTDYGAYGRMEDDGDVFDNGTSLYYVATEAELGEPPLLIDNDTWVRGTYPLIYQTAHTASAHRASETTRFEITHRPDLFPADWIRPELEIDRRRPEPPPHRIPAQPRF